MDFFNAPYFIHTFFKSLVVGAFSLYFVYRIKDSIFVVDKLGLSIRRQKVGYAGNNSTQRSIGATKSYGRRVYHYVGGYLRISRKLAGAMVRRGA